MYMSKEMPTKRFLGIETHEKKRDYCDEKHWDLDNAPALQPLKRFLRSLAR